MSCVVNDDEEVAIELESCEVSSRVEDAVPTLNNIWDDDKIEKVRKQDDTISIEMIYF
jgi:hypothetical protein